MPSTYPSHSQGSSQGGELTLLLPVDFNIKISFALEEEAALDWSGSYSSILAHSPIRDSNTHGTQV